MGEIPKEEDLQLPLGKLKYSDLSSCLLHHCVEPACDCVTGNVCEVTVLESMVARDKSMDSCCVKWGPLLLGWWVEQVGRATRW